MYKELKDVLDVKYSHLKIDMNLYKQLKKYRIAWMQKAPEYIDFLGGKTLGVQPIRFSTRDEELLFTDILNVDIADIKTEIYKVEGINPSWSVSSNPIYLSLFYLIHRFLKSKDMKQNDIHDAVMELNLIFNYKVIGSLISHYFSFSTTEDIAKTTIEKLSNRYLIKRLDNWQELFENRCSDFLPKHGLHYERLLSFSTEDATRVVTDAQGRIRDIVKNIYAIMMEIRESGDIISTTSLIEETEDGVGIKDVTERPDKYITYCRSIYSVKNEFVNDDYVYLISSIIPNIDSKLLTSVLNYMSDNVPVVADSKDDIISVAILKTIGYINSKNINNDYNGRILEIIKLMKNYWTSSSVKDKENKHIKDSLNKIVIKATSKKTKWLVSITVVGVLLYIFLRSIMRNR